MLCTHLHLLLFSDGANPLGVLLIGARLRVYMCVWTWIWRTVNLDIMLEA
jgi:hypothetical protein